MELTFEVTKDSQAIVRTDQNVPVAGSVGYLGATFKLQTVDQLTWTPLFRYLSKQYKPDNTTAESLDGTETIKCVVPHEVIHYNKFYVSIFGVDPSTKLVRVTFPWVEVETEEGCDDKGDSSSDPSLTVYEKVLRDIQDIQSKVVNPDNLSAAIAQYFVDNPIKTLTEKDVEPWIATYVTNNKSTLKGDTGATGPQGESGPQGPKGDTGLTGAAGPQGLKGDIGPKGDTGAVGPKGDIGLTGAIGPQGLKGDTGAAGQNGVDGATGPQGPKGDTGAIGPQGPKGDIGAKGADGTAGTAGTAGKDGADGYSPSAKVEQTSTGATITITDKTGITSATVKNGLKGDTGATGPAGQNGVDGAIGPQGLKGDTGLTGAAGPQGPKGDTGATGATGPQGLKGDTGATGPQGLKGDTGAIGPQGLKGDTGAIGPQGPKGDTGAIGPQGLKGDTGLTGAAGPKGDTGLTGAAGKSAYELAVAGGYTGTQTEWIASLKGPKGDTGATGATGPQGLKGDTGADGLKGLKGDTGLTGAAGPKGDTGLTGAAGPKGDTGLQGIQGPAGNGFLYKATLTVAAWTSTTVNSVAAYTQTVTPTKVNGGPTITAQMQFDGPMCRQTNNIDTNEKLLEVLNIINVGYTVTNAAGTVTVTVFEKPTSDIEVYWKGTVVTS